jgi:tRNA nucleotidyltransferase (CCA-adding enzyme)
MFNDMTVYEVGGCIRDRLMGRDASDIDFAIEFEPGDGVELFGAMRQQLEELGFEIFKSDPDLLCLRARFPKEEKWEAFLLRNNYPKGLTGDFVLCRKDGEYTDGRTPNTVEPGTILDDLARRDFTCNAIAMDVATREYIDPHDGRKDIEDGVLRWVGNGEKRATEDGLRLLRGIRFMVTHGLIPDEVSARIFEAEFSAEKIMAQKKERIYEELKKMFNRNSLKSIQTLQKFRLLRVLFAEEDVSMWLMPTLRERK